MDWEKQDNELRQLMDGGDFLPDEERWNAVGGWKKLQLKRQPSKKGLFGYWMRLAVAASVVGLLGFGLWWLQKDIASGETGTVVNIESSENTINAEVQAIEQSTLKQLPAIIINPDHENKNKSFKKETQSQNTETQQKSDKDKLQSLVNSMPESTILNNDDDKTMVAIDSKNEIENNNVNALVTKPSTQYSKPDVASASAVKKPKIKVVHYNELNGMHSTAPPVFVLIRKSEAEWENISLQNVNTKGSHPYSLKIDISPAPKKSL